MPLRPTDDVAWPVTLNDPVNCHHPLNRGRVAWWLTLPNWEGGPRWFDLMGLYHGTFTVNAGFPTTPGWQSTARPGGWGQLSFNSSGTQNYATLLPQAAAPINLAAGQSVTLACWLKCGPTSTNYPYVVGCGFTADAGTGQGFGINQVPSSGGNQLRAVLIDSTGGLSATAATGAGLDNLWHRAVMVVDRAAAKLLFYLDGVQVASATITTNTGTVAAANPLYAGHRLTTASQPWVGWLDDVPLWLRALSAADVRAEYDLSRSSYPGVLNRLALVPFSSLAVATKAQTTDVRTRAAPVRAATTDSLVQSLGTRTQAGDTALWRAVTATHATDVVVRSGSPGITRVQASAMAAGTAAASPSATWPAATTAGNLLVAVLGWNGGSTVTATPAGWTLAANVAFNSNANAALYYIANAASRSGAETFTLSAGGRWECALIEYSGVATVSPLDKTATATAASTTSPASGTTATTSQAGELCLSVIAGGVSAGTAPTFSAPTNSFTLVAQNASGGGSQPSYATAWHERIVSATGAYGHSDTSSQALPNAVGVIATFMVPAGGGGATPVTETFTTDVIRTITPTPTFTTDVDLKGTATWFHTTNADLKGAAIRSETTDVQVWTSRTTTYLTEALVRRIAAIGHAGDVMVQGANNPTQSVDTQLLAAATRSGATTTLVRQATTVVSTTDGLCSQAVSVGHATDNRARKAQTPIHRTNALRWQIMVRTGLTNTLMRATRVLAASADVMRLMWRVLGHATTTLRLQTATRGHQADLMACYRIDRVQQVNTTMRAKTLAFRPGPVKPGALAVQEAGPRQLGTVGHPVAIRLETLAGVPALGAAPGAVLRVDGGAWQPAIGAVVEQGYGWYRLQGAAADRAVAGAVDMLVTAAGCRPVVVTFPVVAADPYAPPALSGAERAALADAILTRAFGGTATTTTRTLRSALRLLRGRRTLSDDHTMTVYREDNTTPDWAAVVQAQPGAVPVVGTEPD